MLFLFLKYISPTWYYNISSEDSRANHYFLDYRSLTPSQQALVDIDNGYNNVEAFMCDAAYQIMKKGIMNKDAKPLDIVPQKKQSRRIKWFGDREMDINSDIYITNVADNYRFVGRYFHKSHLYRILFHRLITFHNPFKEIAGFVKARKVSRIDVHASNGFELYRKDYDSFDSELIKSNPKVSVVIPTLNRYEYLKDVMADLEQQDYKNFEVLVVDQTDPFNEDFYKGWNLDLKVYQQSEKALWLARNNAIKIATGAYIAMSEDDVRIKSDWIRQHLKCIDFFKSDISAGVFYPEGSGMSRENCYFTFAEQFATGNAFFRKDIMRKTGMYDRQFEKQRSGDGEFGLRCFLNGFTSISNPFADCIDVKAGTGGLRQTGSWDSFRPTKLFAPRPIPSVLYLCRKFFGNKTAKVLLFTTIPYSLTSYKNKRNKKMKIISLFNAIFCSPIVLIQVYMSWKRASRMLQEGDKIEKI